METTLADKVERKRMKSKGNYNDETFSWMMYPAELLKNVEREVKEVNPNIKIYFNEKKTEGVWFEIGYKEGFAKIPLVKLKGTEYYGECELEISQDLSLTQRVKEAVEKTNKIFDLPIDKGYYFSNKSY